MTTRHTAVKVTVVRTWRTLSEDTVWLSEWFTKSCFVKDVETEVALVTWLQWLRQSLVSEWRHNQGFHSFHAYPSDMLTIEFGLCVQSKPRFEWERPDIKCGWLLCEFSVARRNYIETVSFLLHGEHITSPLHLTIGMLLKEITSFYCKSRTKRVHTVCEKCNVLLMLMHVVLCNALMYYQVSAPILSTKVRMVPYNVYRPQSI
jgi:hypothetical protein